MKRKPFQLQYLEIVYWFSTSPRVVFIELFEERLAFARFYEREKQKAALGAVDDDDMDF